MPTLSSSKPTSRAPTELGGVGGRAVLGELDEPPDQTQRPLAECHLGAARRAEQVGDEPEIRALDVGEEERRSAGGDDAAMDLGDFEMGSTGGLDRDESFVAAELIDERREGRGTRHPIWTLIDRIVASASALGP